MRHKRSAKRYAGQFVRRFLESVGALAAVAGVVALFAPQALTNRWWLLCISLALATGWALFNLRQKDPVRDYRENVTIRLVEGDLFEQNASALIGMTTTFDTALDIIDQGSVQGNFLRVIHNNSQASLDSALSTALATETPVSTIPKTGKQTVYPMGTVAVLPGQGAVRYYCVAYASMDAHNRATGTVRSILDGLDGVWEAVDRNGNGDPICVPLLGQGQSRIPELTAEVAVRLIAFSFLLRARKSRFSKELRIVIHPKEIGKIDLTEFDAFLRSLAA